MFCASLIGAGRKGGTPRPLSEDGPLVIEADEASALAVSGLWSLGCEGKPAGSEAPIEAEAGSSGLRRLNKTLTKLKEEPWPTMAGGLQTTFS